VNALAPLRLVNTVLEPILRGVSRDFEKGSVTKIVAGSAWNCTMLLEAFIGMQVPDEGSIVLFGENLEDLPATELHEIRSRISTYIHGGGLIANLKAVENVALPLLYHSKESTDIISEKAFRALNRAGYDGNPFLPPGRISAAQRVAVGLARVFAANPEVVIYDRLGDGLPEAERRALLGLALDFHRERPDRITIFLFPHKNIIFRDAPVTVLNLSEGQLS